MNTIEIQRAVESGEPVRGLGLVDRAVELGPHRLSLSDSVLVLDNEHKRQIEDVIGQCLEQFPTEDTFVQDRIGLPTIIARADCTIGPGGIEFYECEERPAGLGILSLLQRLHSNSSLGGRLQEHSQATLSSELAVVQHPEALPSDDQLVLPVFAHVDRTNGHAIVARGEPHMFDDELQYRVLAEKSASTIRTEGNKMYAARVGAMGARLVNSVEQLPGPSESFILKTLQGSKSRGVGVYLSKADRALHGERGAVTHNRMKRLVGEHGQMLLESLKRPIRLAEGGNLILRVSALVSANQVKVIGGVYVNRPEIVVHGANNAVSGLIELEQVQ